MLRICLAFVLTLAPIAAAAAEPAISGRVTVIDGDSWRIGATRIRLFGIDAPEAAQTCRRADGSEWACGRWVSAEAERRFGGRRARCEPRDTDRYGRTVARCFVAGRDAASELVGDGLAFAYRRYSRDYVAAETAAASAGRGLHAGAVADPARFRADARRTGADAGMAGCRIKGNISSSGARIYHLPGQRNYRETRIAAAKGERWFCSEAEARAAGWRRARN